MYGWLHAMALGLGMRWLVAMATRDGYRRFVLFSGGKRFLFLCRILVTGTLRAIIRGSEGPSSSCGGLDQKMGGFR